MFKFSDDKITNMVENGTVTISDKIIRQEFKDYTVFKDSISTMNIAINNIIYRIVYPCFNANDDASWKLKITINSKFNNSHTCYYEKCFSNLMEVLEHIRTIENEVSFTLLQNIISDSSII